MSKVQTSIVKIFAKNDNLYSIQPRRGFYSFWLRCYYQIKSHNGHTVMGNGNRGIVQTYCFLPCSSHNLLNNIAP